jgi:capsular polysaccharide export protein
VEGDASLRYGAPGISTNAALLSAARARHPDAFLLYKPHPDVLTGLRKGAVDAETLADCADAVAEDASAEACLAWADRVETMTSLMGFEALLRETPVAVHGRPFYAGWGLTEEAGAPFDRGRRLSLDALVAAALILYPRYVDLGSGLPATPERVLDWLHVERAFVRSPRGRLREGWRRAVSRMLNVVR